MSEDAHVEVKCKHCGQRIVLVNYSMGRAWTHQPAGASFQDGAHQYCHRTIAEPDMTDRRPHSRACGWRKHDHGVDCAPSCQTCGGKEMTAEPAHVCVFKLVVGDPAWKCEKC